jgi:hypothetical protein
MVTAKADSRRRVQIPNIKEGTVFSIENNGQGIIVLHELRPVECVQPKCKLIKNKDGVVIMDNGRKFTTEDVLALIAEEFP